MQSQKDQVWVNAAACADVLIFTELTKLHQLEVKGLIAREGNFCLFENKTILARVFAEFQPDKNTLAAQENIKFIPIAFPTNPRIPPSKAKPNNLPA